jgi:multiple sugar transport system permease protein
MTVLKDEGSQLQALLNAAGAACWQPDPKSTGRARSAGADARRRHMTTAIATRPSIAHRIRRWEGLPYWLILPTVVYLGLFFVWPMIQAFELSVHVGGAWTFAPFREMYHDIRFGMAVRFTLIFIAVIVPIQFLLALTMALIANSAIRGRTVFLFIFILPLGVSDLAAGLIWSSIFSQHGYLNTILQDVGIRHTPYIWINPQHQTQLVLEVVAAEIWRSTALITVILIAGLQGIPKEYGEAAEVFGAGSSRASGRDPADAQACDQVALLLRVVFAFEVFATVLAITGQAPRSRSSPGTGRRTTSIRHCGGVRHADSRTVRRSGRDHHAPLRTRKEQVAR